MPKARKQKDRRPDPNLKRERRERRGRQAFKRAQALMRNRRIGGVSLSEDPFGLFEQLEQPQYSQRR